MSATVAQGETYEERLTVRDRVTGDRVDLTGIRITSNVASGPGQGVICSRSTDPGDGIVLDDQAFGDTRGNATITWPYSMTALLAAATYARDVWCDDQCVVKPEAFRVYVPVRPLPPPLAGRR